MSLSFHFFPWKCNAGCPNQLLSEVVPKWFVRNLNGTKKIEKEEKKIEIKKPDATVTSE